MAKAGTPTMGGIAIVASVVFGYAIGHIGTEVRFSRTGYLVVGVVVAFGLIGYLDDSIKVRHRRSLGLNKRGKSAAQLVCALAFAILAVEWAHTSTALSFTRADALGVNLGTVGWVVFAVLVMVGSSNAVNLTDGVDGLAAGSGTFCFSVLSIMGYWIFRHVAIYHVLPASAIDLALVSVALAGACIGFLWWNAAPAKIIMGDTGSLAIGAGLAALCLLLEPGPAAARHRRALRHGDRLGHRPGHQFPGLRPPHLPHGAHPPPLRARRLARDHGDRALLDPGRPVLPPWAWASSTAISSQWPSSRDADDGATRPDPPLRHAVGETGAVHRVSDRAEGRVRAGSSTVRTVRRAHHDGAGRPRRVRIGSRHLAVSTLLLIIVALLCVIGLVMVGSASSVISISTYGSPVVHPHPRGDVDGHRHRGAVVRHPPRLPARRAACPRSSWW